MILAVYAASVQDHGPWAQAREHVLDLESFERLFLGQDLLEMPAQHRNVPLAVVEVVNQRTFGPFRRHTKSPIERRVRHLYLQAVIEHDERLTHRLDDGPRIVAGFPDLEDLPLRAFAAIDVEKDQHRPVDLV